MKRDSLKLQERDWVSLNTIALETGSLYSGKPSWRRLVKRIARGELRLESGPGRRLKVDLRLVSRESPCPCGSGQKVKHCHGYEGK